MKKGLLLLTMLLGVLMMHAQTLEVNETDEFTGAKKKATSWETVAINGKFAGYMQFGEVNGSKYVRLKMVLGSPGKVFSVDKDADVFLKLEDESVIKLKNKEFTVACKGCGAKGFGYSQAWGIELFMTITDEEFQALTTQKIIKLRSVTNLGNVDQELKLKDSESLLAAAKLIVQ